MMEGMPASDSTPKRITRVRFDSLVYSVRNIAVPMPRGVAKAIERSAEEERAHDGGENAAEPAHIFRVGEDEFHRDVREALDEDDKDYRDEDGRR